MPRLILVLALVAAFASPAAARPRAPAPIEIKVVVLTTFEAGADTGDLPGEFQAWVERYPQTERARGYLDGYAAAAHLAIAPAPEIETD